MSATVADTDADATHPLTPAPDRNLARHLPWLLVLLAPVIGVLALRAPIVNALSYRDPYFYSGYGWTFEHHIRVFGWFYYSVRFSATLPIAWTTELFGPVGGYVVLRLVLLGGTGALLFLALRRLTSVWIASASAVLIALSAFYLRMVLWDYTTFVELPLTIAAAATWHLGRSRGHVLLSGLATGLLLGLAIFSNPQAWLLIPSLYGVEAIAALRGGWREVRLYVERGVCSLVGVGLVFLGGWLAYRVALGGIPAGEMVKPTLDFAKQNSQLSAPFQIPASVWLQHEPRIYAPVLMCAAIVIVGGRAALENTRLARLAQFALLYTTIVWLFRKFVTSSVIETWWAYDMTAVTLCFGMPFILDRLVRGGGRRAIILAMVGGTAAADLLIRSLNEDAVTVYTSVRTHLPLLLLVLVLSVGAAGGMRLLASTRGRALATGTFAALLTAVSLAPADFVGVGQTGEFSPRAGELEVRAYDATYRMTKLIARDDKPSERTLLWSTLAGIANIGWANLPHQFGAIDNPEAPTVPPALTDAEKDILRYPTTRRVLLMEEDAGQVSAGVAALRRAGFSDAVSEQRGTWIRGLLHYDLIDLHGDRG